METAIRNKMLENIMKMIDSEYATDALPVSASEIAVPVVDEEGNEKFALIKVSIPRGTRNGDGGYTPYDGYAAAEDYKLDLEDKADKARAREEKKERAAKEKERKANAKKVVKELNEKGLDKMIHEEGE
jgi:hypothetical protein